jgi:nucleoside-diphosphate-sugar epimerase
VVWASSGSVYGPPEKYPQEFLPADAPHDPQNIYGYCKSLDEFIAGYYSNRHKLDITAIRFVMVYGVGQTHGRTAAIIQQMVINPALGKAGKVPAAADNTIGWTYVDDAARAMVMASRVSQPKRKAYNVMGSIHQVKEIAEYIKSIFPGADISMLPLTRSASNLYMACKYDMKPIEEDIGFKPEWTMKQGMLATINEARQEHGLPPVNTKL